MARVFERRSLPHYVRRAGFIQLILGFSLLTALLPGGAQAEPIKFAVIGDFGSNVQTARVDDLIESWGVDFVITVGDNAYSRGSNTPGQRNAFELDVLPSFGTMIKEGRFFPTLGNHDYHFNSHGNDPVRLAQYLDTLRPPRDGPGEGRYYEFAKGPVRFFAINSNGRHEPHGGIRFFDRQGDWLRDRLAASTEPFKVVYFHHPPYTTSSENGPTTNMRWPFKEWGASLVLSGHEHNYERFDRRGLPYVVNGIGGARFYPLPDQEEVPGLTRFAPYPTTSTPAEERKHGAMLVEANDTEMTLATFSVNIAGQKVEGVERDRFTISSKPELPPPVYRELRMDLNGRDVRAWQDFLFEQGLLGTALSAVDGDFGGNTRTATRRFQEKENLAVTGIVDAATREHARTRGYKPVEDPNPN